MSLSLKYLEKLIGPVIFVLVVLTLGVAVGSVVVGDRISREKDSSSVALDRLAGEVPGWEMATLPLGETPEQSEKVESTLQCDQAINLRYNRGELRINLYAGYWRPGKVPVYMVARHTPDVCWVASGWRVTERATIENPPLGADKFLPRVEHRIFKSGGSIEHVCFFHVIDGQISSLAEADSGLGPIASWLNNVLRYEFFFWHIGRTGSGIPATQSTASTVRSRDSLFSALFKQRREQLFVRISSNRPYAEFWHTPVVSGFIRQLPIHPVNSSGLDHISKGTHEEK